jgi:large subunit ribosomal protein L27
MPPVHLSGPLRAAALSSICCSSTIRPSSQALRYLRAVNAAAKPAILFVRHASHQAQGRANGPKNTAGKRLGAKKTGGM